jgi:RNA polymerase sigma-70 factor (ECF subfamily)
MSAMAERDSLKTDDLSYWVLALQNGRPDLAEPTLRKIIARVEKLAASMFKKFPRVGRFVDLDDVIQNSLIRLLAALREMRPESTRHFYALSNELIRRELLDLTRRYYGPRGHGTNLAAVAVGEAEGEHDPAAATPEDDLEFAAAFHEALARLPAEEREAMALTYYHGWPQKEIADLFQVSVRTVQRWLDSATATLKQQVGSP